MANRSRMLASATRVQHLNLDQASSRARRGLAMPLARAFARHMSSSSKIGFIGLGNMVGSIVLAHRTVCL